MRELVRKIMLRRAGLRGQEVTNVKVLTWNIHCKMLRVLKKRNRKMSHNKKGRYLQDKHEQTVRKNLTSAQ